MWFFQSCQGLSSKMWIRLGLSLLARLLFAYIQTLPMWKQMKENHARMNFPLSLFTEGAPVYEQKELRKQRKAP